MSLRSSRIKFLFSQPDTDGAVTFPAIQLLYRKSMGAVPVMPPGSVYFGTTADSLQYVSFTYDPDGKLIHFKNIGREKLEEAEQAEDFFLPFAAIAQVFEQYIKTCYDSGNAYVTRVALEYRPVWEKESGAASKTGRMIPVWNFYGSFEQEYQTALMPLVSIGAADGTIFAGQ